MQAVILILLLVSGSLVHSIPQEVQEEQEVQDLQELQEVQEVQEVQEDGKSMYKSRKGPTNIINAVAAVGYSSFLGDMVADTQAYNLT
jgi:hypothetical protein